jgi:hypothetical protein
MRESFVVVIVICLHARRQPMNRLQQTTSYRRIADTRLAAKIHNSCCTLCATEVSFLMWQLDTHVNALQQKAEGETKIDMAPNKTQVEC